MSYGPRRGGRTTLFVAGFPPDMRAKDLAYEFERMGPLVRCDIPAIKNPNAKPYAFIEYQDSRDAEDAHRRMHNMRFGDYTIGIQFAKNAPSSSWRYDGGGRGPPPRARSPPRGGGRYDDRRGGDDRDYRRDHYRRDDRGGCYDDRRGGDDYYRRGDDRRDDDRAGSSRPRSLSPAPRRRSSRSPPPRNGGGDDGGDRERERERERGRDERDGSRPPLDADADRAAGDEPGANGGDADDKTGWE
ncbi:hypothetical protein V8E36_009330 [Tilletia maclaganii]